MWRYLAGRERLLRPVIVCAVMLGGCGDRASREYEPRPPGTLDFARHIAPILYEHCSDCHRPEGPAPFSLLTYEDARERVRLIARVTEAGRMPPWLPVAGYGDFADERRLSVEEIGMIGQWAREGAAPGDASEMPEAPAWTSDWQLGHPDLVLEMAEAFDLYATGPEIFRNFVIPVAIDEGRYVRAIELEPGSYRAVHHAVLMVDRTPTSRRLEKRDGQPGFEGMFSVGEARSPDGFFLGWTPGRQPMESDTDLAWRLERGMDVVLQLHLRPTGKPERIKGRLGLYFATRPPERVPMLLRLGSQTIDIPAGRSDYTIEDSYVLPVDVDVLGIYPHAHYLGKTMEAYATLRMRYTYDNSAANPQNPNDPHARVVYGPGSSDEMGDLWI